MDDWCGVRAGSTVVPVSTAVLLAPDAEPATKVLLERHLPGDGFRLVDRAPDLVLAGDVETVEQWRDRAPVIVLGRSDADAVDRVHAFRRGCDDYVVPPFDYQELVERIRAVLRRARPGRLEALEVAALRIDPPTRDVRLGGRRVSLSQKEYDLLLRLARDPERVFTKAELLRDVWAYVTPGRTRTLDSHASRLRRKLRELDGATPWVDNVWGVGYRLLGAVPER
jgi:DNA-binding response OmpR family regulator